MADATVSGASAPEELKFPVYLIYSKWSLLQLDNFLKDFGDVGFLRIVYDNDGKETDRTIAILPETVYDYLCEEGYGEVAKGTRSYGRGLRISPFRLKDSSIQGEGRSKTLFVPVPKTLDDSQVIPAVIDKLKHLSEWGIVQDNSWSVNVPLKSREEGNLQSGCFVSFKRDVSIKQVAMIRVLLTDTYWPDQEDGSDRAVFRCFWARDRKERPAKPQGENKFQRGTKQSREKNNVSESDKKKKELIQNTVRKAKPVKIDQKKAPTVPSTAQPTLAGQ